VSFEYREGRWSLSFAGTTSGQRRILSGCALDAWLDAQRRGRLMGIKPPAVKEMGLIHLSEAQLLGGEAKANPDGSATLSLRRGFGGFATDVVWTETYTLPAGQPTLFYRTVFETRSEAQRYLAFVELGGGMRGDYGSLLQGKRRFKYDDPRAPNPILLSGGNNAFTRLGWRGERCWVGVESELGCGVGVATTKEITRGLPGSSVWSFGNAGFFARLIDPVQENFPYEFHIGQPLDLGLAFVATCGQVDIWNQTRQFFAAVTRDRTPKFASSCAVYLDGEPLQAAEVRAFRDGQARHAALQIAFQRDYRLVAGAAHATPDSPIAITVRPFGDSGKPLTVLTLQQAGQTEVDFTGITKWAGRRQAFILEVTPPDAQLSTLALEPAGFPAPELETPADGMSLTDLAMFFRWKQVKGAIDYELQLARDAAFTASRTLTVRSEVEWPYYLPTDAELPSPGTWFWRVRALEPGRPGAWSQPRRMEVNNDHAKKPVKLVISPERPLLTIEACRVKDLGKFTHTIPADLKSYVAINCHSPLDPVGYLKPQHEAGPMAFLRTHGPAPMSHWTPLASVEAVFQAYPNVIGIMGGETLSAHYHGGANQTFMNRLLKLCGKYGRIFYDADGTYPNENKWEELYRKEGALMRAYGDHLVFAQKNNILHRQFVSQSSVLGLYMSGAILHQGAWEDGGWYWQQVGFRKLGDIRGQRGGDTADMPRIFWALNFAMGLSRGCCVYSLDGQTGTAPVRDDWKIADRGLPPNVSPSAHWTTEGELTPVFHRFIAPLIRAMIQRRLIPEKTQVLEQIRLAVYNDGVKLADKHDPYYYEYHPLFAGTYGFKSHGVIPGELMEFFPNTGRYYYIPIFPQGRTDLGHGIQTLPLSQLQDAAAVRARFDAAYPQRYDGNALVTLVGDTLTVLNSNENVDETESYVLPLQRGNFLAIAGTVAPHAYVIGRFEDRNNRLWLQANGEYPERLTDVTVRCQAQPKVVITPPSAAKVKKWDAATGTLTLHLSHKDGAVEVEIAANAPSNNVDPAFAPISDDPKLPRVLIIGDSVSVAYTLDVRKELAGIANVHRPAANCGSTKTALGYYGLERWLAGTNARWDVIHFNHGLHDLSYRFADGSDKDAKGNYASPANGAKSNVSLEDYKKNLHAIVARLRKTGATLIFATTTPVPESDAAKYVKDSELRYNEVAKKVMAAEGVAVNDLWALVKPQQEKLQIPRNVHFQAAGSAVLGKHVAHSIQAALRSKGP
jgi:hypothetical protein